MGNENEELLHALKELKLDMDERNEKIDGMGKEMSELKMEYENVKREGIMLEKGRKEMHVANETLTVENTRLEKQNGQHLEEMNAMKKQFEMIKQQELNAR